MEQYIYDENNGLWYERDGDYYIPCLKLPEINIGIWGERFLPTSANTRNCCIPN